MNSNSRGKSELTIRRVKQKAVEDKREALRKEKARKMRERLGLPPGEICSGPRASQTGLRYAAESIFAEPEPEPEPEVDPNSIPLPDEAAAEEAKKKQEEVPRPPPKQREWDRGKGNVSQWVSTVEWAGLRCDRILMSLVHRCARDAKRETTSLRRLRSIDCF